MPADDSTPPSGGRSDDPYAALLDRRDCAQRELDESVTMMNADAYLMTSRLPGMAASKDQALHELTTALTMLKAAERGDNDTEIERGQWRVIDAASNLCQVTGGNIVELGNLMTTGLASYNVSIQVSSAAGGFQGLPVMASWIAVMTLMPCLRAVEM